MPWYSWSKTAASNATADGTINWAEGQAPSSINDSARALMAVSAMYRDDIAGAIVTGGTNTAYTVASYSVFDTLAHLSGQVIAFTANATNGATVTLNVDSLGAKPLRSAPGVELPAGVLIQGTPYVAVYNNTDGAFYLRGFFGNPYNIPLAAGLDYWGTATPNSSFAFPVGQAISRTTYSGLFGLIGTLYGAGDGSSTFQLPDRRGRVSAQLDPTGGLLTSFSMSPDGNTAGAKGGGQSHSNTVAEMASHSHGVTDPGHTHTNSQIQATSSTLGSYLYRGASNGGGFAVEIDNATTGISIQSQGSGTAYPIIQPTILCNYIMRII